VTGGGRTRQWKESNSICIQFVNMEDERENVRVGEGGKVGMGGGG